MVTAQAQQILQVDGIDTRFPSGKPPHGFEPCDQRLSSAVHDRTGGDRMLMFTAIAYIKSPAAFPVALVAAPCANKAVRPSQREKISPAGLFYVKARIKGGLVLGKSSVIAN